MGLHDGCVTIAINNQSRKVVPLAMHKAISVVLRTVSDSYSNAHLQGRLKGSTPKGNVDTLIVKTQYPYSDRAYLVMANGDKLSVGSDNSYNFAFFYSLICMVDGSRKYPRVKTLETFLLASLKIYVFVHKSICSFDMVSLSHCSSITGTIGLSTLISS